MKPQYVFVPCMGSVWRMTQKSYEKFLSHAANGKAWDLDRFGTYLGNLVESVTDLTAEGAAARLKDHAAIAKAEGRATEEGQR